MRWWTRGVVGAAGMVCACLGCVRGATGQTSTSSAQQDTRGEPAAEKKVQPPSTEVGRTLGRVLKMFEGKKDAIAEEDLSDEFKAAVPIAKLRAVTAQVLRAEGTLSLIGIEEGATDRRLVADVVGASRGTAMKLRVGLNEHGQLVELLLTPGVDKRVPAFAGWDALDAFVTERWPDSGVVVRELTERKTAGGTGQDGASSPIGPMSDVHVLNGGQVLALGSAFKLWVLGALAEAVEKGDARWDEELKIEEKWKSLPSGEMQNEKAGTPFTLRHYAEKMISISDNTATDHVIHRLGREKCEQFMAEVCSAPERNRPLLTTRDMFVLKLTPPMPGDELPEKYLHASAEERRKMLESGFVATGTPQIILAAAWRVPRYVDSLEWFASASDMTRAMAMLDGLSRRAGLEPVREILSINPGVPLDRKAWTHAGFKGGSEPGVMCLDWLLERADGRRFVVSLIFNDTKKAIDESLSIGVAQRTIELLEKWQRDEPGVPAPQP